MDFRASRLKSDTRMNDQSVGLISHSGLRFRTMFFAAVSNMQQVFGVSHGYSKNALEGDREADIWPYHETCMGD
jgi:hypothetical protein